jgi:hypothetical protein
MPTLTPRERSKSRWFGGRDKVTVSGFKIYDRQFNIAYNERESTYVVLRPECDHFMAQPDVFARFGTD